MRNIILLITLFSFPLTAINQFIINEASTDNATLSDETGADFMDFIELKNISESDQNLLNWHLSDDPTDLTKWQLGDEVLNENELIVICADGQDFSGILYWHTNFKIKNSGQYVYLSNPDLTFIDSLYVPKLEANQSVGRDADFNTVYYHQMTPGLPNTSIAYSSVAPAISVSLSGGFYAGQQTVNLFCPASFSPVYTFNGGVPQPSSAVAIGSILINTTSVLKCRCVSASALPGDIKTETYMFDLNPSMSVISLSTDSLNLWDSINGIWSDGPNFPNSPNYTLAWKRYAKFEFFENGVKQFGKEVSIETDGGASITFPKHTLNIKFDHSSLGSDKVNYQIFDPLKPSVTEIKDIKLRNGGNLYYYTGGFTFHDAAIQSTMRFTNVDYSANKQAVLLVNGEYYGLYDLRERTNEDFFAKKYTIPKDDIRVVNKSGWPADIYQHWQDISTYFGESPSFNTQSFLDSFKLEFDYYNFIDYHAANLHFMNMDWHLASYSNNMKLWRNVGPGFDKRHRFVVHDMDMTLCNYSFVDNPIDFLLNSAVSNNYTKVFRNVMQNSTFKNDFCNRYADLVNLYFHADSIQLYFNQTNNSVITDIENECNRWSYINFNSVSMWNERLSQVLDCISARNSTAHMQIDSVLLGDQGLVDIVLQVNPANSGYIHINSIDVPVYPWTGLYFKGVPVSIEAIPNPGYAFAFWDSSVFINNPSISSFNNLITTNSNFTANFVVSSSGINSDLTANLKLFPNPTTGVLNIQVDDHVTSVKFFDLTGKLISVKSGTSIQSISMSDMKTGVYLVELTVGNQTTTKRVIKK